MHRECDSENERTRRAKQADRETGTRASRGGTHLQHLRCHEILDLMLLESGSFKRGHLCTSTVAQLELLQRSEHYS